MVSGVGYHRIMYTVRIQVFEEERQVVQTTLSPVSLDEYERTAREEFVKAATHLYGCIRADVENQKRKK
jgi:hypothetical protein